MTIVPAAALEGPFLTVSSFEFNSGSNAVNYGTTASMSITISNIGIETSNNVSLTLSGSDEYCTLTSNATINLGSIAADQSITIDNAFTFDIADDAPDMHFESSAWQICKGLQKKFGNLISSLIFMLRLQYLVVILLMIPMVEIVMEELIREKSCGYYY